MENSRRHRWVLLIALVIVVILFGIAAALTATIRAQADVDAWTNEKADVVESVVEDVFDAVFTDLEAVAGFVEQSSPDVHTFDAFVDRIDGNADAIGVGYVSIIDHADADRHVAERRAVVGEFYDIFGLDEETALPVPLDRAGRETFYPVQLFSFGEQFQSVIPDTIPIEELGLGIEAGFDDLWRDEIEKAASAPNRALSSFITIDADVIQFSRTFFASVPVKPTDGRPPGLVAALMVEPLLLRNLDKAVLDDVQWEVIPIGGQPERIESSATQIHDLDLPGSPWQLAVAPTDETLADLASTSPWITGMTTGLMAAVAAALLWLLIDRRREKTHAAQLQAVATEKDRFLATVSHELRTPLTVVAGVASEIRDHPSGFDADELVNLHSMIVEETDELTAIVEDLLVAARSDITKVAVTQQQVELTVEIENAMRTSGAEAELVGDQATALADPQRVRQVLRNLLTNAARYGGPEISVAVSSDNNTVRVIVSDNGDGIDPGKRRLVFEPYQSAHETGTQTGSVGLGLYISRSLARAMGGDLTYDHDGVWSRFLLELPAAERAIADGTIEQPQSEPAMSDHQ